MTADRYLREHHAVVTSQLGVPEAARDLANLLTHLHAQAIYHRDLQPETILLTPQGPLVIQLGVAPEEGYGMLTNPGTRLGDIRYPDTIDAFRGDDARRDIDELLATLMRPQPRA